MRHTDTGRTDLGWAQITPDCAYARERGCWTVRYHCGPQTLEAGARIRVYPPFTFDNAHNSCVRWDVGTVTASTDATASLSVDTMDTLDVAGLCPAYTADAVEVTVTEGALRGGHIVNIVLGDERDGGKSAQAQWLSGPDMPFNVAVALPGEDGFARLARFPVIPVYGNVPDRLVCAPTRSTVAPGEPFALRIKAEDAYTNVTDLYQSPVVVEAPEGVSGPERTTISRTDRGRTTLEGFALQRDGTFRVRVRDDQRTAHSPPVSTEFTRPGERIFWGEIHGHCELGDGVGSEDRYYEYARHEAWLDFSAISEHGGGRHWWLDCIRAAREHYEPGRFATLLGYERGWGGGHANFYARGLELPVLSSKESERAFRLIREGKAIMIPHHTNDPLIREVALFHWDENDPANIHAAEICQMRGSFEKDELGGHVLFAGYGASLQDGLAKGFRFGFTGGTDNHSGRPGMPMVVCFQSGERVGSGQTCDIRRTYLDRTLCGLTAVFAPELTREAVFDAIRSRRTYATTGARILVDFRVGDLRMGEQGALADQSTPLEVRVRVAGTAPVASITIVRNNEDVHTARTTGLDEELAWRDPDPRPGSWYYARVRQEDGHLAWPSPVWVD